MKALIVSTTLFGTIIVCLAFGIACGYAAIIGILRAFGHRTPKTAAVPLSAVHVSSGD